MNGLLQSFIIKTVCGKGVAQSIAFRVVSIYWQRTTPSPENLPPSDMPYPVNGILWEMSELNSRTDSHRIFKLGGGVDHVTHHV